MATSRHTDPIQNRTSGAGPDSPLSEPEVQFVFVLEPGFTMHAFSSAVEVLRLAAKFSSETAPSWHVASIGNLPVPASNGISLQVTRDIDDLPRRAIVVVVSGAGVEGRENAKLLAKMRSWDRQGHRIWAISSGVVRLAQAGLVDETPVSAHWEDIPYLTENHPRVAVSTSLFIGNSKHPTCAGGGAAADLMLSFVQRFAPPGLAEDIASRLVIDGVRDGRLRQSMPARMRFETANKTVFAAVRLMENNCFDALPLHEIARQTGVSQRQLERLFAIEFQKTPSHVYRDLRMEEARQEVLARHRPIIDIAMDYGYQPGTFGRVYRRVFGTLPSEDRKNKAADSSHCAVNDVDNDRTPDASNTYLHSS